MNLLLVAVVLMVIPPSVPAQPQDSAQCRPAGPVARMTGLAEASGLAVSRRVPGRLWSHDDSGQPVVVALDARGAVAGEVRVTGATVEDWEAIAAGPCGTGSCLYIGDIGDNNASRDRITLYRVPEPEAAIGSAVAETFHATYPDGAHDAETLLVSGDGRLHIVTKGETGPIALYRFPARLQSGSAMKLERVGAVASGKANADARITDGAVSPDGQHVVLRTNSALTFYRASDLLAGQWRPTKRVDLAPLREPQGEGVALGPGDTVYVAGEAGGSRQGGTFARFACPPG
jgi:hypothetical protein